MNKHQGNVIKFRLFHILNRPYRSGEEGEESMKQDTKEHRKSPQGIQVMVSIIFQNA